MTDRRQGFTLAEVALALSLVLGLLLAIFAFYGHAVDVRRYITEDVERLAAERAVMDGLTDELRSALADPALNIGLEGSNEQIVFLRAVLPGPAAWAVRGSADDPVSPEQDLEMIAYRLLADANLDSQQAPGLERVSQKMAAGRQGLGRTARLMAPHLRFVCFRYTADGSAWRDYWRVSDPFGETPAQAALLPLAVEITMGSEPCPPDMSLEDYLARNLASASRRVVFVPAGARAIGGAIIRGAAGGAP
jgi:type II secretory pathway component PulJ